MTANFQTALTSFDPKTEKEEIKKPYKSKKRCYQALVFTICYLSYGSIHIYREFWSVSKVQIEDNPDKYHSTKDTLSNVDTVNFMVYGAA